MQCHEIQDLLSAYIDGMLDPSVKNSVDRHLELCSACQSEFGDLKMVVGLVHNLPPVEPPPEFRQNLRLRLEHMKKPVVKAGGLHSLVAGRWSGIFAAAASFLLVIGIAATLYGIPGRYVNPVQREQLGKHELKDAPVQVQNYTAPEGTGGSSPQSRQPLAAEPDKGPAMKNEATPDVWDRSPITTSGGGGMSGVAARGISAAPAVPRDEQSKQVVLDIKVDDKITAAREVFSIAQKYSGFASVLPETGGSEIILRVPNSLFEKVITEMDRTGKVTGQDYSAPVINNNFGVSSVENKGIDAKGTPAEIYGKGGSAPGGIQVQGSVSPQGESRPEASKNGQEIRLFDSSPTMATIRVRLQ